MQVRLASIICDTDFLIHLSLGRVRIDDAVTDLGTVEFLVPDVVLRELSRLKKKEALQAISFAKKLQTIPLGGGYADNSIFRYVKKNGGLVGTLDKTLREKLHRDGLHTVTLHKNRLVLEQ